jgi:hypothetical protein
LPRRDPELRRADYCNANNVATIQNAAGSPYSFIYAVSALRQSVAP